MIDIHCHILPGFDDGARDMLTTLKMGKDAQENNVTKIVATPHYLCTPSDTNFVKERDRLINEVRKNFDEYSINVEVFPGAEVHLNEDVFFDNQLEQLTINSTRYLLCELDFFSMSIKRITRYFDEIVSRKLVPILAHPERYQFFQQDYSLVNYLADMGTLFQINMTSLAGIDSDESKALATKMVRNGMAAFLATDAHGLGARNMRMLSYIQSFSNVMNDETFYKAVEINPQKVLNGEAVRTKFNHISRHGF